LPVKLQGFIDILFSEIRPEYLSEVIFTVGSLPYKEIAKSSFVTGAYQEVDTWHPGGVEIILYHVFGDFLRRNTVINNPAYGVGNFCTATIVKRYVQGHTDIVFSQFYRIVYGLAEFFRKFRKSTDMVYLDTAAVNLAGLPAASVPVRPAPGASPLPVGVQVVGPRFGEGEVLKMAGVLAPLGRSGDD